MYYTIPEQKVIVDFCDVYFDYNHADPSVGAPQSVTINRVMRGGKNILNTLGKKYIDELKDIAMDWFCENFDGEDPMDYED